MARVVVIPESDGPERLERCESAHRMRVRVAFHHASPERVTVADPRRHLLSNELACIHHIPTSLIRDFIDRGYQKPLPRNTSDPDI